MSILAQFMALMGLAMAGVFFTYENRASSKNWCGVWASFLIGLPIIFLVVFLLGAKQ